MTTATITLTVNGETRETRARTLADLIAAEDLGDTRVATAVNGTFVPVRARESQQLQSGDNIEILSARQGG